MSTQTVRQTGHPIASDGGAGGVQAPASAAGQSTGPFARIIGGAMAAGALLALVLMLVVFPAGSEPRITGAALLGFAVTWLLIWWLSDRFTAAPQRWALVPAAAFGSSGLALTVIEPGAWGMAAIAWVWPPIVLGLVGWMWMRTRRSLPRRGRWLLTPVLALVAASAVGALFEDVALFAQRDDVTMAAPGARIDLGPRALHLDCRGPRSQAGSPTVVLLNGLGESSASWARIVSGVQSASGARVCAYDRAGQGWSDPTEQPQEADAAAADLHAVLAAAGERGPFVLVGHSSGGTHAMTYAQLYADQVSGMVLLDSSSPEQATRIPGFTSQLSMMRRVLALTPSLYRLGLGHLVAGGSHLPEPAASQVTKLGSTPAAARNLHDEQAVVLAVFARAQALRTLGHRPLAVVTASESAAGPGWSAAQQAIARLSDNSSLRTVDSSHSGLLEDPTPAAESVRAISGVIAAVRTGQPVR